MNKFKEILEKYESIGMTIAVVLFFGFWFWVFVQRIDIHLALYATSLIGLLYCFASLQKAFPNLGKRRLDWNELRNKSWQLAKSESKRVEKWIIFTIVSILIIAFSFKVGTIFIPPTIGFMWIIMFVFWWDSNIVTADGFVKFELRESEDEDGNKGVYAIVYGFEIHEVEVIALPLLIFAIPCGILFLWTVY